MQIRIKEIMYIIIILTGIFIERYGIGSRNPELEKYFGWGVISLGSINLVIDYFRRPKKK